MVELWSRIASKKLSILREAQGGDEAVYVDIREAGRLFSLYGLYY